MSSSRNSGGGSGSSSEWRAARAALQRIAVSDLADRNEMRVSVSDSYALLFFFY